MSSSPEHPARAPPPFRKIKNKPSISAQKPTFSAFAARARSQRRTAARTYRRSAMRTDNPIRPLAPTLATPRLGDHPLPQISPRFPTAQMRAESSPACRLRACRGVKRACPEIVERAQNKPRFHPLFLATWLSGYMASIPPRAPNPAKAPQPSAPAQIEPNSAFGTQDHLGQPPAPSEVLPCT
jgi:hypothetical protein